MISKTRTIVSSAIMLALLLATPLAAAATTAPSSASDSPKTVKPLAERITARKAAFTTKLSDAEQASLKIKCKPAQVKTTKLAEDHKSKLEDRQAQYAAILKRFGDITAKLKEADYKTDDLLANAAQLEQYIDTFNENITEYTAALADVNEVDCVTDPVGYRAALEAARQARVVMAKDSAVIRSYITDTLQPALTTAKAALTLQEANPKPQGAN